MSEKPVHCRPRRLADWINPTGAKKVHSLIDKVYQRKNLEMAWETVKANRGSGGVDGQSLDEFAAQLDQQLDRLQSELKEDVYRPQPVTVADAERVFPGARQNFEAVRSKSWSEDPWQHGGLARFDPGELDFIRMSARREGRIHFAGEHTSRWNGWMQGAIESGQRAAKEISG